MADPYANPANDPSARPMRLGLGQITQPTDERLQFIKQLGVNDVVFNTPAVFPPGKSSWDLEDPAQAKQALLSPDNNFWFERLVQLKNRIEGHGLRLHAIANFPYKAYDEIMLGGDRRDEQIEVVKQIIRVTGKLDVPIFGYHWMPNGVWRTSTSYQLRGGAESTAFNLDEVRDSPNTHGREYNEEEMWDNYEYFLEEVLPVAERAGVRLALHPDDPPVSEKLGGVPRLFRGFEQFKRAMELVPSDNHGLEFCLGNWSAMGADLHDVIEYFGEREEIFHVHFQTISGTVPSFNEVFIDDSEGYYDPYEVMQSLKDSGFNGVIRPGHVPQLEGDDGDWRHRGRAYTIGYMQRILDDLK